MPEPDDEPYVGLRPYAAADARRFFGRSRATYEVTSLLLSSRLVVLYGPPGVGKTSLVQAGVLAGLGPEIARVLPVARPPRAAALLAAPAESDNPFTFELLTRWVPDRDPGDLREARVADVLESLPVQLDRYREMPVPLVAAVDQFEEVFRCGPDRVADREELFDQLAEAIDTVEHLHLLLAMRQDVVGEFLPYESRLSGGGRHRYQLEALDPASALEAVTEPLKPTSRSFAPGAAEKLVDRLRTVTLTNEMGEQRTVVSPSVEPINLQVVCSALWRGLPDEVTIITAEHLQHHGDVEDTLTQFCMRAVIDVAAQEGIDVRRLWRWLVETFVTDLGTRGAAYEGLAFTAGMPNTVARAFEQRRILRSEERSGSMWFELLHDGLIEPIRRGRQLAEGLAEVAGPDARPDNYLLMAESALHSGRVPLAEQYARGAVRASEHDVRTLAEAKSFLGELVFDQGRTASGARAERLFATAEDNLRDAAELFEAERNSRAVGRVLASLGRLAMERGRFADAVRDLQSAVERLPNDAAIRLDFARALHRQGQVAAARSQYTAVVNSAAPDAKAQRVAALVGRGALEVDHGDPATALHDLDEAVRLDPGLGDDAGVRDLRTRATARLEGRR